MLLHEVEAENDAARRPDEERAAVLREGDGRAVVRARGERDPVELRVMPRPI